MQTIATNTPSSSAGYCATAASGWWFASRKILLAALAAVVLGGAAAFGGWDWLVATGVALLLLSVLACLVTCGLDLCKNRMRTGGGGRADQGDGTASPHTDVAAAAVAPVHRQEGGVA